MSKVKIEPHADVAVLRLANGVTNAISPELLDDLKDALNHAKEEFKGLILAGGTKFFSIGFDLPTLLQLERPAMTDFYFHFNRTALDLYTVPLPTACAISGHAIAGGTILALTADFRFASSGRKLMGLNEVKIGVPVPYLADLMLRQIVGDRAATELNYSGEFVETEQARKIGLLDDVCPPEELERKAIEKVASLAGLPPYGFNLIKENRVEEIRSRFKEKGSAKIDLFLNCWFDPAVQELLKEAAKKF
ncbi:MAG: enoyl-CoA hydratase/isomerase family protein [Deltaproteobacteria bacterium]|jgi:enoyl-CoA hydratase/carnithine racemase